MSMPFADWLRGPGPQAAQETAEASFLWGRASHAIFSNGVPVLSSTTDSGSTITSQLRPGLLMGKITSSGKYTQWSATATDGSELVAGILAMPVAMLDMNGVAQDRVNALVVAGPVKNASITGLNALARSQMRGRFVFDDDYANKASVFPWMRELSKTANYTVTAADNGTLFDNLGASAAVVFTLPTLAAGLSYGFNVQADQSVTINSAAGDDMVAPNDASADGVAFSTPGDKIGGFVRIYANPAASKWVVEKPCSNAMSVTT